ncbi:MAG: VWA domain-containing protein [Thermodesulfobacteriota bacterium]|nr:VWA domain-containing protein [Thermodesulfobacteriota bacterium]
MLKNEILALVKKTGTKELTRRIFNGIEISRSVKDAVLTSLLSGHHILILGPPGCGKTALANKISETLGPLEVVRGCPLNCQIEKPTCPWCVGTKDSGQTLRGRIIKGAERVKRVQGSSGLVAEDLLGDLDPELVLVRGIHNIGAFLPGKLLRSNHGVLLIDFIDKIPDRVLNTVLYALQCGSITIGPYEEKLNLDILVVATGSIMALHYLPLELIDYFDVIKLGYLADLMLEKKVVLERLGRESRDIMLTDETLRKALDVVSQTRTHSEVQRGVSTRGAISYIELLPLLNNLPNNSLKNILRTGAHVSLPHRLEPSLELDTANKGTQIVEDILNKTLGTEGARQDLISISKEDIIALVEEIARKDKFRKPLKYGAFDLLLRRIKQFPESRLALVHREAMKHITDLYPALKGSNNLTQEILTEIEQARIKKQELSRMAAEMESKALRDTLNHLEENDILVRGRTGWDLSQRGLGFLLEGLMPGFEGRANIYGYGKHSTGRKSVTGDGRIIGNRKFRFGDRYRDICLKETMREALRNRRLEFTRNDIRVAIKDIHSRTDILLTLDLSGTMRQLEKLWYAKESAIALGLAATRVGDRVGLVTFSNQAEVVVDLTTSVYKLTAKTLDLDLHDKAFTNIGNGLLKACQLFSRRPKGDASRHIILISDGDATAPHPSPQRYALRQAAQAARKGITISCICINEESADPDLMRKITRIGKGRIYLIEHEQLKTALLAEREILNARG